MQTKGNVAGLKLIKLNRETLSDHKEPLSEQHDFDAP